MGLVFSKSNFFINKISQGRKSVCEKSTFSRTFAFTSTEDGILKALSQIFTANIIFGTYLSAQAQKFRIFEKNLPLGVCSLWLPAYYVFCVPVFLIWWKSAVFNVKIQPSSIHHSRKFLLELIRQLSTSESSLKVRCCIK